MLNTYKKNQYYGENFEAGYWIVDETTKDILDYSIDNTDVSGIIQEVYFYWTNMNQI